MGAVKAAFLSQCPGTCADFLCSNCRAVAREDKRAAAEAKDRERVDAEVLHIQRAAYEKAVEDLSQRIHELRKELADARAESITLRTMLVDCLAALTFYADITAWSRAPNEALRDVGKRARVTMLRVLDAGARFGLRKEGA